MRLKRFNDFINESADISSTINSIKSELSKIVAITQFTHVSEDAFILKHTGDNKENEIIEVIEKYVKLVDFDVFKDEPSNNWVYDFIIEDKNEGIEHFVIPKIEKILPNIKFEDKDTTSATDGYTITSNGETVTWWRFMGPEDLHTKGEIEGNTSVEAGEYLLAGTIVVEDKFRRKGIYTAIIYAGYELAKSQGLKGIASLPFDIDSGDFERTPEATAVWEKLIKADNKIAKITDDPWDEGDEVTYIMN